MMMMISLISDTMMVDDFFLKIHTFVYQNWQQYRDSTRAFKLIQVHTNNWVN